MQNSEVKIDELVIRLPGEFEEQARNMGREITRLVAERLPLAIQNRKLDSISLKVNVPEGASQSTMISLISEELIRGLV